MKDLVDEEMAKVQAALAARHTKLLQRAKGQRTSFEKIGGVGGALIWLSFVGYGAL